MGDGKNFVSHRMRLEALERRDQFEENPISDSLESSESIDETRKKPLNENETEDEISTIGKYLRKCLSVPRQFH